VTLKEAFERVISGERFEDPEILKLASPNGWSVAHEQAWRGWTTLDPDILSLLESPTPDPGNPLLEGVPLSSVEKARTVLDVMLLEGWEPKTEEEKLIVFTVKAGA